MQREHLTPITIEVRPYVGDTDRGVVRVLRGDRRGRGGRHRSASPGGARGPHGWRRPRAARRSRRVRRGDVRRSRRPTPAPPGDPAGVDHVVSGRALAHRRARRSATGRWRSPRRDQVPRQQAAAGFRRSSRPSGPRAHAASSISSRERVARRPCAQARGRARALERDHNAYAATLARCYVEADLEEASAPRPRDCSVELRRDTTDRAAGSPRRSPCARVTFQPKNAARIEAIRDRIAFARAARKSLESVLLVSLMEAADRVDLLRRRACRWPTSRRVGRARASNDLALRMPAVLPARDARQG